MSLSFHPEAEKEFNGAIDYYEGIDQGLGYDFGIEVLSAIKRAVDFPRAWSVLGGDVGVRRSLCAGGAPSAAQVTSIGGRGKMVIGDT